MIKHEDRHVEPVISLATTVIRGVSPLVEHVAIDGQVIAWDSHCQNLHLLDPPTSLIFQLADGTTTIAETINEIRRETGLDRAVVQHRVVETTKQLVSLNLLTITPNPFADDEGPNG